jgi:hypothetical protein
MRSDPRRVSNVTYVCVCGVLCWQRLCDGPIRRPGSPNKCPASRQIPNLYRLDSRRLIFSEVNSESHPAGVKYVKVEEEEEKYEEKEREEAVTERENCIMKCYIIWITAIKSKKK